MRARALATAFYCTQVIEREIGGDAQKPGLEVAAAPELISPGPDAEKCFLDQIVGGKEIPRISGEATAGPSMQSRKVSSTQMLQGGFVTSLRALDQAERRFDLNPSRFAVVSLVPRQPQRLRSHHPAQDGKWDGIIIAPGDGTLKKCLDGGGHRLAIPLSIATLRGARPNAGTPPDRNWPVTPKDEQAERSEQEIKISSRSLLADHWINAYQRGDR